MVDTAVKVVGAGAVLAILESVMDFFLLEHYTGEFLGTQVTYTDVLIATVLGLIFATVLLLYTYHVREEADKNSYIFAGILGLAGLIFGGIFANIVVIAGAVLGYLNAREK